MDLIYCLEISKCENLSYTIIPGVLALKWILVLLTLQGPLNITHMPVICSHCPKSILSRGQVKPPWWV